MLVGTLIAELQKLDPDLPITVNGHAQFTVAPRPQIGSVDDANPVGAIIAANGDSVIRMHYDLQPQPS